MHDYLGCVKAVDESVGRLLDYLDEEGLAENTIVVYCVGPGLLPRRARLVRQAVDLRGVAADAAARALAGRDEAGQRRTRTSSATSTSPRRSSRPPGVAGPGRHAGPQPGAAPEGADARRLAEELLLPLLRVPRPAPRPPALRRRHRPLQARPLLRAGRRLLGAVRPEDRPEGADERLRQAGVRRRCRRSWRPSWPGCGRS